MFRNIDIVRKMYEALEHSDRNAYRALTHPDIEWCVMEGFPHGGTYVGQKAVFEGFFPALMADFDDWHVEAEEILDAGEAVVGLGQYRGRAKSTGAAVVAPFAHVFRLQADKIVRVQQFTDTVQFARALAGEPPRQSSDS